ncbi:hypothetical protein DL765_001441 [Monosporascus sp. GIB2]|nr:hypothetical protein DL765_001441 [Monosporascus sp. GIB2]
MMQAMQGGFHPGAMPQHPGVPPGHPMAPGMAHNPSQPGAQPGMPQQMAAAHMGVSGPGGQVNPAALMGGGMAPGAGPNAHAMHHLNPQMFQQQQQFGMNNPNMVAIQQQRMLQQRQLMAQAQQMGYGNMGGNGMGMNMNMNAAQFAAMRNQNMRQVGVPPHMQQAHLQQQGQHPNPQQHAQMMQQLALHQQQQAANNQMQQGGQHGHPGLTPQQLQQLQQQQQQQMANQMAAQASSQGQPNPQNPQPQPQPQPQHQPQPPQQPGQQPQPVSQPPQRAPTPAMSQAGQPQNQLPTAPQPNQPQQPQGQNQPPNQPQTQPQQPNPQLLHAAQQQQHHHLANNLQHQIQQQQQKNPELKGHCLLKLMLFAEHLSGYPGSKGRDDLVYWQDFVSRFFSRSGVFRLNLLIYPNNETNIEEQGNSKQYEIAQPALARYFYTHFTSGMRNMQLTFEKGTVDKSLPTGHFIENPKASLIYWYDNSHVVAKGSLRAQFDHEQKIELLEFHTESHDEYVSRKMVIERALPAHQWVKDWNKVNSQDSKLSPEISKKGKTKMMKSPPHPPPDLDLPDSAVKNKMGITEAVFQFLEIVEVMGQMNPLFHYYTTHPGLSPYDALEQYVKTAIPNAAQQGAVNGQQPGNMPGGTRTPGFPQFQMGASPAAAHLQLPGSPSMGSPAQGHMQAPGMALQQSQQGTNSSGPSANTSPASNKRRRPSGVKTEDDSGAPTPASIGAGPQVNGVTMAGKTKPQTPRMQKRAKAGPA